MVRAISDSPGTEKNINIKEAIYSFQKVGVLVQVLSRAALNANIFVIFNAVPPSVT